MNRVVLITGAASGLGLSLAERFLRSGDTVFGITRTQKHWKAAKRRVGAPARFILKRADVTSERQVQKFVSVVRKIGGRIDLLIHCAGYAERLKRLEKQTLKEFQKHLSSNLISTFLLFKYTIPLFRKSKKGWIINIASYAGKRAVPFLGAYSASKFGVLALTQAVAKENPDSGFHAITVCPGGMNTTMRVKLFGRKDAERQQAPEFVADKILEIIEGKIGVESGGDVVIRHGQITAVNPLPPP